MGRGCAEVKRYAQLITCNNCHYTRTNSDWYTSKETKILYCTKDCYLAKEKGINNWWNEDKSLNIDAMLKNRTITVNGVTMPVPQGQITSSEIFTTPEVIEEPVIPEEPTEIEQKEEERENEDQSMAY